MKITAVMCVRNEEKYLDVTLSHLAANGISLAIIDNDSTDRTQEICEKYQSHIVYRGRLPYDGAFSVTKQLAVKSLVYESVQSDWFIHMDADEILQSPRPGESLREGFERITAEGWNAVNFDEFVFLPEAHEAFEERDFFKGMRHYYFFEPCPKRLMRAWRTGVGIRQIDGGHRLGAENLRVAPEDFILRHYPSLSLSHARNKHPDRVIAGEDIAKGWHVNRLSIRADEVVLPPRNELKVLNSCDDKQFDKSDPWKQHFWNKYRQSGTGVKASICIATREKPEVLQRVLDSIYAQSPGFEFEVIVVMDGAGEATRLVCAAAAARHSNFKSKWIPNDVYRNPSFARNIASKMACGDILIHQSDDVLHEHPHVIRQLVEQTTPQNFVIATVWNADPATLAHLVQYTGQENQRGLFFLGAVTRANYFACGGNCEEFDEPGWEDNWLEFSLTRGLRLQLVFSTDAVGLHLNHPRAPRDHFLTRMRALYVEKQRLAEAANDPRAWMQEPWPYQAGRAMQESSTSAEAPGCKSASLHQPGLGSIFKRHIRSLAGKIKSRMRSNGR